MIAAKLPGLVLSLIYIGLLAWLYDVEILRFWSYMGFGGAVTAPGLITALTMAVGLALLLPVTMTARALVLTVLHYAFLLPSVIILCFAETAGSYAFAFALVVAGLYGVSAIPTRALVLPSLRRGQMLGLIVMLVTAAIAIQVAFGGLSYFNLDLESVYLYRRAAAAELPSLFGYLYSNVSKVLIPIGLVTAIIYRSRAIAAFVVVSAILLFGMTHHKSVVFTPFVVLILFFAFQRLGSPSYLGLIFVGIGVTAAMEVVIIDLITGSGLPGTFTSYTVRRALLVPPMLDNVHVSFFETHPKYYWSTSRLGLGIAKPPSDVSAAFLIGREHFGDDDTSANTGLLGSGYANAGLVGVGLYAVAIGVLLSALDAFGRRIGHGFVAAISVVLVITITTTTDLTTALLTHGLLMLVAFLTVAPPDIVGRTRRAMEAST